MTTNFKSFTFAALLVLASLTANAGVVPHSMTIVVESPETHPILAKANPEAMYLHDTNDGRTLLYIEAENGRKLISLDDGSFQNSTLHTVGVARNLCVRFRTRAW